MKPIYTNFKKIFGRIVPVGLIIVGVSSCSVSQNTPKENDGVYYDPSTAPAEEVVVQDVEYKTTEETYSYEQTPSEPIRIGGKYFDDGGNAPDSSSAQSYQDSEVYNDDRENLLNDYEDEYVEWGDNEGVDVYVNNYYNGYGPSWYYRSAWNPWRYYGYYGPMMSFGWNYGWNSWGMYNPYFSSYYGWGGWPLYGFGGWYGPYSPYSYYQPYHYGGYYNGYYGYNGWYRNDYVREVYRGRGNQNGITRSDNTRNATPVQPRIRRTEAPVASAVTPSASPRTRNEVRTQPSEEINIRPRQVRQPNVRETPVRQRTDVRQNDVRTQPRENIRTTTPRREQQVTPRRSESNTRERSSSFESNTRQRSNSSFSTPSGSSSRSSNSSSGSSSRRR